MDIPVAERTAGGHRLYSEKDIAGLRWVKSQVDSGLAVSRAVIAVRALEADGRLFLPVEPGTSLKVEPRSNASLCEFTSGCSHPSRPVACRPILGEMLAFYSPEDLTLNIIGPTLSAIGEAWEKGNIIDRHRAPGKQLLTSPPADVDGYRPNTQTREPNCPCMCTGRTARRQSANAGSAVAPSGLAGGISRPGCSLS